MMRITQKHTSRHQNGINNHTWRELDEQEMLRLYCHEKRSTGYVAKKLQTGPDVISRHLKAQGIILRSQNEQLKLSIHQNIHKFQQASQGKKNRAYRHGKKVGDKKNRREYLEIAKKHYQWICSSCSALRTKKMDLIVHHIDHNNRNNTPENLKVICQRCHMFEHGLPGHNALTRVSCGKVTP